MTTKTTTIIIIKNKTLERKKLIKTNKLELCIAFRINHFHIRARDHLPMYIQARAHTHKYNPYGYPIRIHGGLLCKSVRDSNVFVLLSNEQIEIKEK